MTDYIGIALTGFSTGIGVISANKLWEMVAAHYERLRGL
jgi:hypothetical protein